VTAPTLAEFMSSERPAWLWDGERARIVWANAEGVRWFGGETLFDLIDQPFDAEDEAIARIKALAHELPNEATARETLRLPSPAGEAVTTRCCCSLHPLADGRPGLLVVVEDGGQGEALPQGLAHEMLMALPLGVVLTGAEGDIRFANAAARDLVAADRFDTFAGLIADADQAKRLLARAAAMRLASAVVPVPTRYGRRELRMTAKLLAPATGAGASVLILLDDVTDRRTLERALSGSPGTGAKSEAAAAGGTPPAGATVAAGHRLSESDRRTFEALAAAILKGPETPAGGASLEPGEAPASLAPEPTSPHRAADDETEGEADRATVAPEAPAVAPAEPELPEVPGLVSRALDALAQAVVLHRQGELLFANRAAVNALGFAGRAELLVRRDIGEKLAEVDSGDVLLAMKDGTEQRFRLTRSSFPWNTGPVSQSTLVPVEAVGTAEPAELAAEPQPHGEPGHRNGAAGAVTIAEAGETAKLAWEPVDAELRAILDTATDGIITLDENGHIRGFSAGAEALFGYRLSDVAGRPFTELLAPESRKVVRNYLAALDHSGLASVFNDGREVEAVVAQGTVPLFIAIGRIGASGAAAGRGQAYCVVVRDLTQWKKTEADLRRAKEEAERASAQKSEFLANISHELRTPLNAILGFSEVMRSQRFGALSNQKYLGYANDIHESGEHLLSLINDLLDLSKVEAGKLELNFTSVNLAGLVEQCLAVLQEHAAAGQVVLRKNIPAGLPNVVADQRSVKQILLNLISNAVKFTDPGGQVIVSARLAKSGELTVSVKDTGIGMSEAELRAAIQPFKRIESPGREQAPGTGLGLPLSRALTEANRARFAISSEPRKGTLVEITFPTTRVLAG
jgi:PAS domain S-box-containing protein